MLKRWQKLVKSLHNKKFRYQEGLFLVEGEKSVVELLTPETNVQGIEVEALFYTSKFAQDYIKYLASFQKKVPYSEVVTQEILQSVGTLQTNDSILAVAHIPQNLPFDRADEMALALADIRDPGNLGTIIRIADWYGISKMICSETTTDFYSPKVISASMGSFLRVKPYYCQLDNYLRENFSDSVYGAFLDGKNIYEEDFKAHGIIVIGNESNGISDEIAQYISHRITIPRFGKAESLNAAIATAIICDNWKRHILSHKSYQNKKR
ncbi:MAG: RNA methyltransferase [Thermoflexibacter sp.]